MIKRVLIAFMLLSLIAGASMAATSGGVVISARITSLNCTYSDSSLSTTWNIEKGAVADVESTVDDIFGLLASSPAAVQSGGQGDTLTFTMTVTNQGNTTDSQITYATGNNSVELAAGDNSVTADWLANTSLSKVTDNLAEEEETVVSMSVLVPNTGVVNSTTWNIMLHALSGSTPIGTYSGYNGTSYGGEADVSENGVFVVSGIPFLEVISYTVTVSAPTEYVSNGGAESDVVPGAKLKYTIVVENKRPTASASATYINFSDFTPDDTTYLGGADEMDAVADNGVAFDVVTQSVGELTWEQSNSASNSLAVDSRVTFNFTVTVD
jgi:hypothetical protein